MKKVFLALAVVAMIGFASCSKTKTCKCHYNLTVLGVTTTVDLGTRTIENGTCADLENAGEWNAQVGNLANAEFHCERVK